MDDKCKLSVANETLDDLPMRQYLSKIEAHGIAMLLPDAYLSQYLKQKINEQNTEQANRTLILELTNSLKPDKLETFLEVLQSKQGFIAKNIMDKYHCMKVQHQQQCPECQKFHTNRATEKGNTLTNCAESETKEINNTPDKKESFLKCRQQLDWGGKGFFDSQLACFLEKCNTIDPDIWYEDVELMYNNLTMVPKLTCYPIFKQVKCLCLNGNEIKTVDTKNLPSTVEILNLSYNKLESVPDVSQLEQLRILGLVKNKISELHHLPVGPDLKTLKLSANPIKILSRGCFNTEHHYCLIKNGLGDKDINSLKQPPPKVFREGFSALNKYFNDLLTENAE